ncbi:MAG TPA: hypothetical protein DCQ58_00580 [Saprospirales bacterium]|nr:hypothetical protein [Saprospirales bacterium]HRJ75031.1 hypothetical protein [Anaerolineales bacterium]
MTTEIIVASIGAIATILAAYIGASVAAKRQVDKGVKEISENLPSWDELFEHDENGKKIKGDINRLIEAVHNGYPIKVKINRPQQQDDIELMDAEWIFVENKTVVATNTSQISLGKDKNGNYRYFKDAYHYYVIVSSKGQHHATRIHIDGRPKGNPTDGVRRMTWIGLVPPRQ